MKKTNNVALRQETHQMKSGDNDSSKQRIMNNAIEEIKSKGQAITFLGLDKKLVNRGAKEKSLNYRNDRRRYLSFLVESFNESTHE